MFSIKITFPKVKLQSLPNAVIAGVNVTLDEVGKDLDATKATFKSPNTVFEFVEERAKRDGDKVIARRWTDNENYVRLVRGTGLRPRAAKTSCGMRFREGYRPRTQRGRIGAGSSARFGKWVRKMQVVSGAIEPREFDKDIAKAREPDLVRNINREIAKAINGKK